MNWQNTFGNTLAVSLFAALCAGAALSNDSSPTMFASCRGGLALLPSRTMPEFAPNYSAFPAPNTKDLQRASRELFQQVVGVSPSVRVLTNQDKDKAWVLKFIREVRLEYGVVVPEELEHDLKDIESAYQSKGGFLLFAERDGRILGTFAFVPISKSCGEIRKFYLAKDLRGQGIGSQMVQLIVNHAHSNGFDSVQIETNENLAHGFFSKSGFKRIEASSGTEDSLLPENFFMQRPISRPVGE